MRLYLLLILACASAQAFEYQGEFSLANTTFFEKDETSKNEDQQPVIDTSWKFTHDTENKLTFQLEFLARVDANDPERNIATPLDTFIRYSGEANSVSVGTHIFNWSVLEVFHPVDTINSRNFDVQGEKLERLGQPSLVLTHESESTVYQAIYLISPVDPKLPTKKNRIGFGFDFASARYATDDQEDERWPEMPQYGARVKHLFDPIEVDVQVFRKYATHIPFFVVPKLEGLTLEEMVELSIDDFTAHPTYFPMTQTSLAMTAPMGETMFKLEVAYFDFDDLDYEQLVNITLGPGFPPSVKQETKLFKPQDYGILGTGLEYTKNYESGHEGTFFVEHQLVWDLPGKWQRLYSVFQNDLALGYRHNFNDFNSWDVTGSYIVDSYEPKQSIFNLSTSFRFYDDYKFESSLRVINSPRTTLDLQEPEEQWGLRPIVLSDNVQFKITRYF